MKPRQVPTFTAERCPSAREPRGPRILVMVGQAAIQASAAASLGLVGVVGMVVGEVMVVMEGRMGHVRHTARITDMVQASQVAPA